MKKTQLFRKGFRLAGVSSAFLLLLLSGPVQAQEACLLQPVPLAERVAVAPLIVEARVGATRSLDTGPHLITLNELEVFKVFAGALPAGPLTLVTAGGTVGLRREVVSNEPGLAPDDQGIFLLEPHPGRPGTYRLVTGPQGLIRYHLPTATAADAFARYTSIPEQVYPMLEQLLGHPAAAVRPNQALQQRLQRAARPAATPVVSGFSPTKVTAGTNTVLTITGSGFGATQGNGSVQFSNANNGGSSFVAPVASDYVSWSDTQIQVRVPASTVGNSGPAGTGRLLITNATSETTLSPSDLTVNYALTTVLYSDNKVYRVALVGQNGAGGYTLTYNDAFAANTAAVASFERGLNTWRNGVGANRVRATGTTTVNTTSGTDNLNIVAFDDASALPGGTLGVTYQYFAGCGNAQGGLDWLLDGTDYIFKGNARFTNGFSWQYGPAAPTSTQYDFESVALHELGHGILQGHIIKPGAVMHYAISNGSQNRVLSSTNDVAGGNAIIDYSLTAGRCGDPIYTRLSPALPVTLVRFGAERVGDDVALRWETAAEVNSAYFALETTLDPSGDWTEIGRVPAAGTSSTPHRYQFQRPAAPAQLHYYRLRQTDEDGTVAYSSVAVVGGVRPGSLAAYPNPFSRELQVLLPAPEAATLCLFSLAGHLLLTQAVPAGRSTTELLPASLPAGVYLLEWRAASGRLARTRVVKQ